MRGRRRTAALSVDRGDVGRVEWGRRKLLALLSGAAISGMAVLIGLTLAVYYTFQPAEAGRGETVAATPPGTHDGLDARDRLALRPMDSVAAEAARPGPLTSERFGTLRLPGARGLGAAGVATGYPQTPEGALAQLVAIDQAALQSGTVPGAQAVISGWAAPGGPSPASWSGVRAVGELLAAAGLPGSGSPTLMVSAAPELGLVKGTVGPDYAVVCVDFVVTATVTVTARVAVADCQRMVWSQDPREQAGQPSRQVRGQEPGEGVGEGRWLIGPGLEPAQPPSVWPGTQAALDAGYRELIHD